MNTPLIINNSINILDDLYEYDLPPLPVLMSTIIGTCGLVVGANWFWSPAEAGGAQLCQQGRVTWSGGKFSEQEYLVFGNHLYNHVTILDGLQGFEKQENCSCRVQLRYWVISCTILSNLLIRVPVCYMNVLIQFPSTPLKGSMVFIEL